MSAAVLDQDPLVVFMEKQEVVYDKFRSATESQLSSNPTQLKPDPIFVNKTGGLFVYLKQSPIIADLVGEIAHAARQALGGKLMVYGLGQDMAMPHTTIFTYKQGPSYNATSDGDFMDLSEKLSLVAKSVADDVKAHGRIFASYKNGFAFNETTVILQGMPNHRFVEVAKSATDLINTISGTEIKMPWGAHLTVGRFLEVPTLAQARMLRELCTLQRLSSQEMAFSEVCAGHYKVDGDKFVVTEFATHQI